jgi:hypothetical protein
VNDRNLILGLGIYARSAAGGTTLRLTVAAAKGIFPPGPHGATKPRDLMLARIVERPCHTGIDGAFVFAGFFGAIYGREKLHLCALSAMMQEP